ncbi:MAG: class I SAM-dependent methyltransferase [Actinomycetota bacterium]
MGTELSEPWPEHPLLAETYDVLCAAGRWDLDFYLDLAAELEAGSILDIGCGTGVFLVDAAARGLRAVGVDPAAAVLDVARSRPGGDTVEWISGGPDRVPSDSIDLAVMMGHVAQYFVTDDEWAELLAEARRCLVPGGHLSFETRNPSIDWSARWVRANTEGTHPHPRGGSFTSWTETRTVAGPDDSYTITHQGNTILPDGQHLQVLEHLRFRNPDEVRAGLEEAGFTVETVWGDWDRSPFEPETSLELIVLARA